MSDPPKLVSRVKNTNPFLNDYKFIGKVVSLVTAKLGGIELTAPQVMEIQDFIESLTTKITKTYDVATIQDRLVTRFVTKYKDASCMTRRPDVREWQKSEIGYNTEDNSRGTTSFNYNKDLGMFGNASPYDVQRYFNPQALVIKTSIVLDTKYRKLESGGNDFYSWDVVEGLTRTQGSSNVTSKIRDVISLRIMKTRVPFTASAQNDLGRMSILIDEFSAQSFVAQENRKFHFIGELTATGDFYEVNFDQFNEGVFNFNKPVTTFSTMSLYYGSPIEPISFDDDRTTCLLQPDTVYTATPTIVTQIPHKINTGNRVYLSGFTTSNPTADAYLIQALNNKYYAVTKVDDVTLQIPDLASSAINIKTVMKITSGTITVAANGTTVTGLNTAFDTDLKVNGSLVQYVYFSNDGKTFEKREVSLPQTPTATSLTLVAGTSSAFTNAFLYYNTTYPQQNINIYFDSKRIITCMEISHIAPQSE